MPSSSPSLSSEEDDPYAPRSTSDYYNSDSSSSSSSSSSTSSASASSSASSIPPSESPRERNTRTRSTRPTVVDETAEQEREEPLFGSNSRQSGSRQEGPFGPGDSDEEEEEERDSFYAILNVQKEASSEEIRDAYRSLAIVLHPDKHTSPELKASAENRFRAIQRAYEVLADAEKRSIYDHFGARGLTQSWSLVNRSSAGGPRTAAEMRDEWERVARKKKAEAVENLIRSKGEFTASMDASSLFCAPERVMRSKQVMQQVGRELAMREKERGTPLGAGEEVEIELPPVAFSERWNRIGVTSLTGKHGWETPLTGYTRLLFNGQMVSRNGMGGGNLIGTLRTQWNPKLSTDLTMTLMRPRVASVKATYGFNEFSWLTFVASSSNFAIPPQLSLSYAQRLSSTSTLTGFTSVKSGSYRIGPWGAGAKMRQDTPSIVVGLTSSTGSGKGWSCQTSLGIENQAISTDYSFRPAFLGSPKVSVGLSLGVSSGLSAFQSLERKMTENVKIGFGVNFGIPHGGVSFQLRFNRLGQKLTVPVQLSPEYRPDIVGAFTVVPMAGMLAIEHLYLKPNKRRKIASKLADLRKQNSTLIQERRTAAIEAINVLREAAKKKADLEKRRDGLVVLQAYYGKKNTWPEMRSEGTSEDLYEQAWSTAAPASEEISTSSTEEETMWCDVQIAVMILVNKGQLIIPGGRHKSKILGFFDPCMGERKHLIIRYLFRNRLHETIVDDITQLVAPLRDHEL
jgi:DnaJ family protein C protein 11